MNKHIATQADLDVARQADADAGVVQHIMDDEDAKMHEWHNPHAVAKALFAEAA